MNVIFIIIAVMVYMFIGALIGLFTDEYDAGWIVLLAAFWPVVVLLYIPIKLAEITYKKFNMWRYYRK